MIVYREQKRQVRVSELLARIAATADPEDRLILTGALEAGVADALAPEFDNDLPPAASMPRLPETITVSVPEGFAWYALYPETYRMAAREFRRAEQPGTVVVIGIRSIGATLAIVVAEELRQLGCAVHSWTVRPRGHPFDRRLAVSPELESRWRALGEAHFVVVDEGPGLSGSSFACVANYLGTLGIPDGRIVLFPSWQADPASFVSEAARRQWPRHRKYVVPFERLRMFDDAEDLSGGGWRRLVYGSEADYPAVEPRHERRKYVRGGVLWRFAGLGSYGRRTLERARMLEAAGFGPPVEGLERGFLGTRWVSGSPVRNGAAADPALIDAIARYLTFVRREFPAERAASLVPMIRLNVEEGLGPEWAARMGTLDEPDGPAFALDNRMFPHEWLAAAGAYIKADGTDHHDDHFYPGPQDIAWDIAAATVEFGWSDAEKGCLLRRYRQLSGDYAAARRLPFYRLAWLAFRLGYTDMAAGALGASEDAARFRTLRGRYAALLRREVESRGR